MTGYLRSPALSESQLAFVCEDALWVAERDGGLARRLTSEDQSIAAPCFSPDGRHVAFASDVHGVPQVYAVPVEGGVPERLTFEAEACTPVVFRPDGRLVFRSTREANLRSSTFLYQIGLGGGGPERLPVGRAMHVAFDEDDDTVAIGLNSVDNARWKRYRGGMAGDVWIGSLARQEFRRLIELAGGPVRPVFVGGRVYFLSDEDGVGNLWSCAADGTDARQHTRSRDFYARGLSAFGHELVYTRAGVVYRYDTVRDEEAQLAVNLRSSGVELRRRFVPAFDCLQELELAVDGKRVAGTFRGKAVAMECWGAGTRPFGLPSGVRYRLARWLGAPPKAGVLSGEIVVVSDEGGEEGLEVWNYATGERTSRSALEGTRRIWDVVASPARRVAAVIDISGKLQLYDFDSGDVREIAASEEGPIRSATWSADGRWLAYIEGIRELMAGDSGVLHLFDTETGESTQVNTADLPVSFPAFDPDGRHLYVLSERTFNPVIDTALFGAICPQDSRVYAYVLAADGLSPFDPRWVELVEVEEKARKDEADKKDEDEDRPIRVEIDLAGLDARMVEFPDVEAGSYTDLQAGKGCVMFLAHPIVGLLDTDFFEGEGDESLPELHHLDLKTGELKTILAGVEDYQARGNRTLIVTRKEVHLLKTGEEPPEDPTREGKNRDTGLIDLGRIRIEVVPGDEWRQMYLEAWRMQRDHFWSEDMAQVDWEAMRDRYLPVLERVATRSELSDLIWELQGELGTSHAYETSGDYPAREHHPVGLLGADLTWDGSGYRIDRILDGDPWRLEASSPLADAGVLFKAGDSIVAVDGQPVDALRTPNVLLAERAKSHVELTVVPSGGGEPRRVVVRTLASEGPLRYRDWVKRTRAHVLARSEGKLGYLHIPDMDGQGLYEFRRAFRAESKRHGLIVDVRNNGGGFVSELVIDHLRHEVIQYERPRHGRGMTYPIDAVRGPMVALCDQFAGSDGDIFCHAFKVYGLGPLIGKRTWGGVIGIDMNGALADGTIVTQPEYAFWSTKLAWGIENRGVEPDIEVELDPASMAAGRDPQLEQAIEVALELLAQNPVEEPDWGPAPSRRPSGSPAG